MVSLPNQGVAPLGSRPGSLFYGQQDRPAVDKALPWAIEGRGRGLVRHGLLLEHIISRSVQSEGDKTTVL